jgi:hypothetical protein
MRRHQLVGAIRRHQQRMGALDAPAGVAHQVERGVVGPVQVFEHHQRGPFAQQVKERDEGAVALASAIEQGSQRVAGARRDVVQGAQGPRYLQRLARAIEYGRTSVEREGEGAQQAGLADAGLAFDEDEAPGACTGRVPFGLQLRQQRVTFEQAHRRERRNGTPARNRAAPSTSGRSYFARRRTKNQSGRFDPVSRFRTFLWSGHPTVRQKRGTS